MNPCPCQTDFASGLAPAAACYGLQLVVNKEANYYCITAPAKIAAGMDFLSVVNADTFSTKISTSNFPLELAMTYRSRTASTVVDFSISRTDSGTRARTKTFPSS